MEQFFKIKGWAFPIAMGTVMPIVMPTVHRQGVAFPGVIRDIIIFNIIALVIARLILNIPKINEGFLNLLHIERRNFLTLVIEQFPTATIFSTIMGFTALLLNVGIPNWGILTGFFLGLPLDILVSVGVQTILELILNLIVKPIVVNK